MPPKASIRISRSSLGRATVALWALGSLLGGACSSAPPAAPPPAPPAARTPSPSSLLSAESQRQADELLQTPLPDAIRAAAQASPVASPRPSGVIRAPSAAASGYDLATPPEGSTYLRYRFAVGDVRRYSLTTTTQLQSPDGAVPQDSLPTVTMDMTYSYQVLDVAPDGSARVKATIEQMLATAGDVRQAGPLVGLGVSMQMAPDGTTSDAQAESGGKPLQGVDVRQISANLASLSYPRTPVHPGDTYNRTLGSTGGTATYRVVELGERDGEPVARLDSTRTVQVQVPQIPGATSVQAPPAQVNETEYVRLRDGWPVEGSGSFDMAIVAKLKDGRSVRITGTTTSSYHLQ